MKIFCARKIAFCSIVTLSLSALAVWFAASAKAQTAKPPAPSKAHMLVQSAYDFQKKLQDSTATIEDVIQNWSATAANPDVKKDPDALAIAYGCEGILEIQRVHWHRADSLLRKALPLFRKKSSKEPVIVAYAELERSMRNNTAALGAYDEIVHTMDSIPALWDIEYYRRSGYAPYAYAIDASFGIAQIAATDAEDKPKAVELLKNTFQRHPNDALGMMDVVALHWLGEMTTEQYKFNVDLLCSRKPELRATSDLFEKKFAELGKL